MIRRPKKCGKGHRAPPTALRKKPLATRNFSLATSEISTSKEKLPPFRAKKEERTRCVWALSSSLYKYTTFFREKQTALTYRNTP